MNQDALARDYEPRFWCNDKRGKRPAGSEIGASIDLLPHAPSGIFELQEADPTLPLRKSRTLVVDQNQGPYKVLESAFADLQDEDVIEIADNGIYRPKRDFVQSPASGVLSVSGRSFALRGRENCSPIIILEEESQTGNNAAFTGSPALFLVSAENARFVSLENLHFRILRKPRPTSHQFLALNVRQIDRFRAANISFCEYSPSTSGYWAPMSTQAWPNTAIFAFFDGVGTAWIENCTYWTTWCAFAAGQGGSRYNLFKNCLGGGSNRFFDCFHHRDAPASIEMRSNSLLRGDLMIVAMHRDSGTDEQIPFHTQENLVLGLSSLFLRPSQYSPENTWRLLKPEGDTNLLWLPDRVLNHSARDDGVFGKFPGPALGSPPQFEAPARDKDPYRQWKLKKNQPASTMARDGGPVGVRFEYLPDIPDVDQLPSEFFNKP